MIEELSKEFFRYNSLKTKSLLDDHKSIQLGLWSEIFKLMQQNNLN
jgi:hypothetical protein